MLTFASRFLYYTYLTLKKSTFCKDSDNFLFLSASRKCESAGGALECAEAVGHGVRGRGGGQGCGLPVEKELPLPGSIIHTGVNQSLILVLAQNVIIIPRV